MMSTRSVIAQRWTSKTPEVVRTLFVECGYPLLVLFAVTGVSARGSGIFVEPIALGAWSLEGSRGIERWLIVHAVPHLATPIFTLRYCKRNPTTPSGGSIAWWLTRFQGARQDAVPSDRRNDRLRIRKLTSSPIRGGWSPPITKLVRRRLLNVLRLLAGDRDMTGGALLSVASRLCAPEAWESWEP